MANQIESGTQALRQPDCVANRPEVHEEEVRFHWIPVIGDDVFLVWNSGYTTYPQAPYRFPDTRSLARPVNGAFVVKIVHRLVP